MHKYSSELTSHMYLLLFPGHFPNRIIRWVTHVIDKMHILAVGKCILDITLYLLRFLGQQKMKFTDDVNMLMEAHKNVRTSRERNPGLYSGKVLFYH